MVASAALVAESFSWFVVAIPWSENHISLKPKFKSVYCSDLGTKTPAASTPRRPLHQCSSSGPNRPVHILPRPDILPVSTSTENSDVENKEGPFAKLDRLQAKTMKLHSSLTKKAKKNPPTLAYRYIASPNVLRGIPGGWIIDLTMSSSSSPEHEVAQTTEECPISVVPVSTKEVQGPSQALERIDCPISSVPKTEKNKTQSNPEEGQQLTETEKIITSQSKEGKTDAKIGTTSGVAEKRSEETKTADNTRPEKRKEKKSGEGDKDSQFSSSSRSSGRSKRQTQFFESPLKHSVKNIEGKSGLQMCPFSLGDIPSSPGNTPSPSPRRKLRRPTFATNKPEQVKGKKLSDT